MRQPIKIKGVTGFIINFLHMILIIWEQCDQWVNVKHFHKENKHTSYQHLNDGHVSTKK